MTSKSSIGTTDINDGFQSGEEKIMIKEFPTELQFSYDRFSLFLANDIPLYSKYLFPFYFV